MEETLIKRVMPNSLEAEQSVIGSMIMDKDAIVTAMEILIKDDFYHQQYGVLFDAMIELYDKYGYHMDAIETLTLKGLDGLEKMKNIMDKLKNNTPTEIAGRKVLFARNYDNDTCIDMATNEVKPTGLPKSNVVYYDLEGDAWLCVRPSGTEPKIKFYYGVVGTSIDDAKEISAEFGKAVLKMIDTMM